MENLGEKNQLSSVQGIFPFSAILISSFLVHSGVISIFAGGEDTIQSGRR